MLQKCGVVLHLEMSHKSLLLLSCSLESIIVKPPAQFRHVHLVERTGQLLDFIV